MAEKSSINLRNALKDSQQTQFLNVITRDDASSRFNQHLELAPLGREQVPIENVLNRILAENVVSDVDVPAFDRSNVYGFALVAAYTHGAMEEDPRRVGLNNEVLSPGRVPECMVRPGLATSIATGSIVPRGADAIIMVENTDLLFEGDGAQLVITRAVVAGENISYAGTDVALGETVLRAGQKLTSREIGVLAAIGRSQVWVYRKPKVAVFSTGNEIVAPGEPMRLGAVYDSNASIIGAAVEELGGEPIYLGVVPDDDQALSRKLQEALACDMVLLSGGTSKGAGDVSYRVVSQLTNPGIVAHGVALKPGKPICLAVTDKKPVVILPGFPTSAIFTFHEFVAPVIRAFAGHSEKISQVVSARLPVRINSERGRTEYLLVGLVASEEGWTAYPMGKGSGSVTTFSGADGFVTIAQQEEIVDAGTEVGVQLLSQDLEPPDLVIIGSHCVGLDRLIGELLLQGLRAKALFVGSVGGLAAAKRAECDIAGIHLMDPETGAYNQHLVTDDLIWVPGYGRMQGIVFRQGDSRFEGKTTQEAIEQALNDPDCAMVNRNLGSGTRVLIDRLLGDSRPTGYGVQTKSHNAVAACVAQRRADWGLAIETVVRQYKLGFIPLQAEQYDFVIPKVRANRPAVKKFCELLKKDSIQSMLRETGFDIRGGMKKP
ncbi:MAG: molybdopterin biosynthesis protein [Burkholderiaceae bacterium]